MTNDDEACEAAGRIDVAFSRQGGKTVSAALDLASRLANISDGESLMLVINGRTLTVSTVTTQAKPTPTQADVDALVKAVTELRAAEWAGVGLSSAKMADRVTPDQIRDGAFRILQAQTHVDTALTPFQKG